MYKIYIHYPHKKRKKREITILIKGKTALTDTIPAKGIKFQV